MRQHLQRNLERSIRRSVLVFCRWTARYHLTRRQAARRLCLSYRTLAGWEHSWQWDRLRPQPRGRPLDRAPRHKRNEVIGVMRMLPRVGVPTLEALFPEVARAELIDLRRRFRRVYHRKNTLLVHALRWSRPGAVWAIDYSDPPLPIEGQYDQLLAVRDLASGKQLAWLPVHQPDATTACNLLEALFREHGPPLILKADNGGPFHAEEMQGLLDRECVTSLFSPPRTPRYNGACEAGIGSMKIRTHHASARHDRPGQWTCDDCEEARLQANELARTWGADGPTPDQAWEQRQRITAEQRAAFKTSLEQEQIRVRQEEGYDLQTSLGYHDQAALDRVAIRRALVALGVLLFSRRRIPLPIKLKKVARIW
jgi:transposase InsO family protein